jgi:Fic family protein
MLTANLFQRERISGYRSETVFIKSSRQFPPPRTAILDCMEPLFKLLKNEKNAFVRAVLGHFILIWMEMGAWEDFQ